ncbi:hypothetical protein [Actinobacillus capsulatus]|uniref:hypothetical protein n=1 Tax=Actinobacillus capsulatus TaxID=717 RepID=UPI00035F0303|nr:hypothetical protein [Actinobacillus capsulatus]
MKNVLISPEERANQHENIIYFVADVLKSEDIAHIMPWMVDLGFNSGFLQVVQFSFIFILQIFSELFYC